MKYRVNGSRRTFILADALAKASEIHRRTGVFVAVEEVQYVVVRVNERTGAKVSIGFAPVPYATALVLHGKSRHLCPAHMRQQLDPV